MSGKLLVKLVAGYSFGSFSAGYYNGYYQYFSDLKPQQRIEGSIYLGLTTPIMPFYYIYERYTRK